MMMKYLAAWSAFFAMSEGSLLQQLTDGDWVHGMFNPGIYKNTFGPNDEYYLVKNDWQENEQKCPSGYEAITDLDTCKAAYYSNNGNFADRVMSGALFLVGKYQGKERPFQVTRDNRIPAGCSINSLADPHGQGGDFVGVFNTPYTIGGTPSNGNMYSLICKSAKSIERSLIHAPTYNHWARGGWMRGYDTKFGPNDEYNLVKNFSDDYAQKCPTGYEAITDEETCKAAYQIAKGSMFIKGKYDGKERGPKIGSWAGAPPGCSVMSYHDVNGNGGDFALFFVTPLDCGIRDLHYTRNMFSLMCKKKV